MAGVNSKPSTDQGPPMIICSMCNEEHEEKDVGKVQSANPINGTKDQFRCKYCNSSRSKVNRMVASHPESFPDFDEVTGDDRKELIKKAQLLCGSALAKVITEAITTCTVKRISETAIEDGSFFDIDEVQDMFKDKPTKLANIMAHAPRMTCRYSQAEMILVPKYSFKRIREESKEHFQKRKIESEQHVKKLKVEKAEAKENQSPEGDKAEDKEAVASPIKADVQRALTPPQVARLAKVVAKLEKQKMSAETVVVRCDAEDMAGHFPAKTLDRVKIMQTKLEEISVSADGYIKKGMISTNQMKVFVDACKQVDAPLTSLLSTLKGCVEAKDEEDV